MIKKITIIFFLFWGLYLHAQERKGVFYHTIHFEFKSLMIDTSDYIYLDSLALKITIDSAFTPYSSTYTDISFFKKYRVYFLINCCEKEKDSFMGLERAKVILDYLYNKYKIERRFFFLQLPDSYTVDCHHPTIDIVFLPPKW